MNGVVLWSDPDAQSAVIWCEDHGDLAYYEGKGVVSITLGRFPDAGDYVSFDIEMCENMRIVRNPKAVAHGTHPGLVQSLRTDREPGVADNCPPARSNDGRDNLVRLSDHRPSPSAVHDYFITHHG